MPVIKVAADSFYAVDKGIWFTECSGSHGASDPPSQVFSDTLIKMAEKDEKIVAINAAMPSGTGLDKVAEQFPDRTFDVGIAEQHAMTFATGLAMGGDVIDLPDLPEAIATALLRFSCF